MFYKNILNMNESYDYKSKLQIYCQKKFGGKLPSYDTKILEQSNEFISTVTLPDGTTATGKKCPNKKSAEKDAAFMVMYRKPVEGRPIPAVCGGIGELEKNSVIQCLTAKIYTFVLVDLENYPQMNQPEFLNTKFLNVRFEAFVGKRSSHAQKNLEEIYPFMNNIVIVDSVYKDAVDHFISVRVGQLLGSPYAPYDYQIIIVSRDAFAGAVVDCVQHYPNSGCKNCFHVTNAKDCFNLLTKA